MPPTKTKTADTRKWHFFRAGGVDQVSLNEAADVLALKDLDQKLWVALAMPVSGIDIDAETLKLVDRDHDARIRVPDLLETIAWIDKTFAKPEQVLKSATSVDLSAIKDAKVAAGAKRVLTNLGKGDAKAITIADALAVEATFANTVLNGDGIVIPESADDPDTQHAIRDAVAAGSVPDRSGKPGVDQAKVDAFFAEVDKRAGWLGRGKTAGLLPLADLAASTNAADAIAAVRAKIDDFFTRARIAEYDPRAATALRGQEQELLALATRTLSVADEELAKLPIAALDGAGRLSLGKGLNPAWASRMKTFADHAVTPVLGARDAITPEEFAMLGDKFGAFDTWRADKPTTTTDALEVAWLEKLAGPDLREKVKKTIADDSAHAEEYAEISNVAALVRLQRDFGRLLRNFVNFSDFYGKQDAVFQAGTLYLDARAMHLCIYVEDVGKHSALATSSDSYLAYCDIKRKGDTRHIAVAVTNGDADNLFVGRNGVFYDRENNDWDATVTKIIANPISIREAFWSPYKKLAKFIEDNVTRRASAADAASTAKLDAVGKNVASVDSLAAAPAPAPVAAAPAPPAKKIDLGTVAAIGVAIGGIGTLVGTLLGAMFGLGMWLPLGLIALLLLVSGPSMMLAWLKLRRRNLGPMLDANGWAINGRARINVAFGAAMTELAALPKGARRSVDDPFADKRTPWRRWVILIVILVLAGTWYVGKLDKWLPDKVRSVNVLGKHAPAYRAPVEAVPAAAPAPAPAPAAPAS